MSAIKFLQPYHEKIVLLKPLLVEGGLFENKTISLGFSGGKDSSSVLVMALMAMQELKKEGKEVKDLYVLYSDTLMELLPVQAHTYKVLDNIKTFAKEHDLPIQVLHAKPELEQTMWSLQIAKGFRPPSIDNRYCTSRLKTDVQERMIYEAFGTEDVETISIVGSRKDESVDRAQRLESNTLDGHLKGHSVYAKSLVFAPIEDFTTDEVWSVLFSTQLGRDLIHVEELFTLYATTNGEGEECQTILGNANENGKNPGCAKSGGRFGCWNCGLQHGKDAALVGMQTTYPYIKYLIRYRNWSSSTRDGQWERYRDYYNHKDGTRLQYNLDNHRFGMTCPGGMSLKTRKLALMRLLWTEKKVNESADFQIVSDEELVFIQHRWILEGDLDLTAVKIAKRFNRDIEVSEDDLKLIKFAKALYVTKDTWKARVVCWFNIHVDKRFAIQFVKQIAEKYSYDKFIEILKRVVDGDESIIADHLTKLQLSKQFYPSESLKNLIFREWKVDKVSYVTKALVNDYEETWTEEEKEYEDLFEDPNISMQDKYDVLDNWSTYQGEDTDERFVHPEYMRYGGHFQFVKFRERQSEENRTKNKKLKEVKAAKKAVSPKRVQQSLDLF